jgi:nucleoside-diphosphate-sugar epimerase
MRTDDGSTGSTGSNGSTASNGPNGSARSLRVTVLGGSGGLGNAIVRELAIRGHEVTAVNRGGDADVPDGVGRAAAHVEDVASTLAATAGADVVVMATQPPYADWPGRFEAMVDHVLAAAEHHGSRVVMVDNLYMYGAPDGPIREDTPERATTPSNVLRRDLARRLLNAHDSGRARVAIGRCSDYYGPRGTNTALVAMAIRPGLAGKPMRAVLALDVPHTFHYLPDAARGFAALIADDRADGQAWILPAAPAITQRDLLELIGRHLPAPAGIGRMGPVMLRLGALFVPDARGMLQVAHQFAAPWLIDASRFESTFGPVEVTPHRQAVAETMAWFQTQATAVPATRTPGRPRSPR